MADPVSIAGLAMQAFTLTKDLWEMGQLIEKVTQNYKTAASGIRAIASQCSSYRIAVIRISKWLSRQNESTKAELEDDFWRALLENLQSGAEVIMFIEKEIVDLKNKALGRRNKAKYVWNVDGIAIYQNQLSGLMSALAMLIQVIDMPTIQAKREQMELQKPRLKTVSKSLKESEQKRAEIKARHQGNSLLDEDPEETSPHPSQASLIPTDQLVWDDELEQWVRKPSIYSHTATPSLSTSKSSADLSFWSYSEDSNGYALKRSRSAERADEAHGSTSTSQSQDIDHSGAAQIAPRARSSRWWQPVGKNKLDLVVSKVKLEQRIKEKVTGLYPDNYTSGSLSITPASYSAEPQTISPKQDEAQIGPSRALDSYFSFQAAMSGIELDHGHSHNGVHSTTRAIEMADSELQTPDVLPLSPPSTKTSRDSSASRTADLYRARRSERKRPVYHKHDSSDTDTNPLRMRPIHRVQTSRTDSTDGSLKEGTPPVTASTPPPSSLHDTNLRLALRSSSQSSQAQVQNWSTNALNKSIRIKVTFEQSSLTNRISTSAARLLGVLDRAVTYGDTKVVGITLLNLIEGDASCVVGDEVEFELMSEYSMVGATMVLGGRHMHLMQIMEEGEYVYWNPGAVPEKLRTVDRLRLLRRFELVRW